MVIPQSLTRPALPGAVNREGAVYSPLTLTCSKIESLPFLVFGHLVLVTGSVAWNGLIATRGYTGADSAFFFLCRYITRPRE